MYIPASFRQDDLPTLHELIRERPLGTLVSSSEQGLVASLIPFLLYPDEGANGCLRAHIARANPHWLSLQSAGECMVIFQGEQGYITPSWYPSKQTTHKVVPTWNYVAVQIKGQVRVISDAQWLHRQLSDVTAAMEGRRLLPWTLDEAPADFIAAQKQAIVGLEIPIREIEGKWKMSQNRSADDARGVVARKAHVAGQRGLVGREVPAVPDGPPEPGVQRLDRVRGVDDPPRLRRERQKRSKPQHSAHNWSPTAFG